MAQKRGKGGYGSENYDPKTGRYIKDDNKFHAGVGASVEDLLEQLKSGFYDEPDNDIFPSQVFANDKDDETEEDEEIWNEKSGMISYLQEALDEYNTREAILNTNFPEISFQEYRDFYSQCEQATNIRDRGAFYNEYRGAGNISFEFNKALRFGLQKFYDMYPQFVDSPYLNPEVIAERARKFDNLTNAWEFPEDKKVIRFVDTAPLLSWFGSTGIFDDMAKKTNEYNIEVLKDGYNKQEIVKRLNTLVGTRVPPDGSFTSFSCVSDASHMAKNLDNNKRHILIRYNVRKGTKAFISNYEYESEGIFNRHTGFFIQGASLENIGGKEVIVLEYGIQ